MLNRFSSNKIRRFLFLFQKRFSLPPKLFVWGGGYTHRYLRNIWKLIKSRGTHTDIFAISLYLRYITSIGNTFKIGRLLKKKIILDNFLFLVRNDRVTSHLFTDRTKMMLWIFSIKIRLDLFLKNIFKTFFDENGSSSSSYVDWHHF